MDSSISELVMLKYKQDMGFFNMAYPASLRPQGKEIIRTWLYYTVLRGYLETGKLCFKDVWVNQHIVDSKGFKMSKSKGNGIDPLKLLNSYGSESIRFWAATEGDLSKQDLKCSEDRISAEKKTVNKILNLSKFVKLFNKPENKPDITKFDKLFIDYIDFLTSEIDKSYSAYNFYNPAEKLRNFIWTIFSSHYVEIIKNRAYNQENLFNDEESKSACWTLYYIFEKLLYLLYPIIPKITSFIGKDFGLDLLNDSWPTINSDFENSEDIINSLIEFNSLVWKNKKEKGISLKDKISEITIPSNLKNFEKDLIAAHNLQ
jgi:valyl-tRNA synthetase